VGARVAEWYAREMRISWLTAEESAAAKEALTAGGASWEDHFAPDFTVPALPPDNRFLDWSRLTEHVARSERVQAVLREHGLAVARVRFGDSPFAVEVAVLAAASHEAGQLELEQVTRVLRCPIDPYVCYAQFLELLVALGRDDMARTVGVYEEFVAAYAEALSQVPHGARRIAAVRDGLADFYVTAGLTDAATALFERRHQEDQGDVAVALSASRAFLAAGAISHAVRWLGVGAARAEALGRVDMAERLRAKQVAVRRRMS
jgi:hypothetical protein